MVRKWIHWALLCHATIGPAPKWSPGLILAAKNGLLDNKLQLNWEPAVVLGKNRAVL